MNDCFQIYHLQSELKIYLQNLLIFTGKNIAKNFKNKNSFKIKTKILLLANVNQTLQIQKCKNIVKQTNDKRKT